MPKYVCSTNATGTSTGDWIYQDNSSTRDYVVINPAHQWDPNPVVYPHPGQWNKVVPRELTLDEILFSTDEEYERLKYEVTVEMDWPKNVLDVHTGQDSMTTGTWTTTATTTAPGYVKSI